MKKLIKAFNKTNKKAQAVLEYGLLLVMISLPLVWGVNKLLIAIVNLVRVASPQIGVGTGV